MRGASAGTAAIRAILRPARRLARATRGATALEFSLVVAPLMALLVAILQTSLTFFAQQTLDTTAEKSVRQLLTGNAQAAGMTQAQFKTAVCANLPAFMKCSRVMVDVQVATTFAAADTTAPTITFDSSGNPSNAFRYAPGGPGEITIVKIMYIWPVQSGPLGFNIATLSNGARLLMATSVFKTEPYA